MRRYPSMEQLLTKDAASGLPRDPWTQLLLTQIKLAQGDPVAAQSLLEQVPLDFSPARTDLGHPIHGSPLPARLRRGKSGDCRYSCEVCGWRLRRALRDWAEGQIARARGDKQKALAAFAAAREKMEAHQGDKPKDEEYFARSRED